MSEGPRYSAVFVAYLDMFCHRTGKCLKGTKYDATRYHAIFVPSLKIFYHGTNKLFEGNYM